MRIKCPKCGSSSQVELTWEDSDNYSTTYTKEYECGCGCHFEVTFKAVEVEVVPK